MQTNPRFRSVIDGCTFNIPEMDTDTAVFVQGGDAEITNNFFTGSCTTKASYFIQIDPSLNTYDSGSQRVKIDGNVFFDQDVTASGYVIHLPTTADDTVLQVTNNEFYCRKTVIRFEGVTGTRATITNNLFDLYTGYYGVDIGSTTTFDAPCPQGQRVHRRCRRCVAALG